MFPSEYADLLDDATPAILVLTTLRRDGAATLAPVWFVAAGHELLIPTDANSLKARHIANDPRVSGVIMAPGDHLRYLHVRGSAQVRNAPDFATIYRRVVWRYERREPQRLEGHTLLVVQVREWRGFDYREYQG